MMFPRLGRGSRLMPNVKEVYTRGSGAQMKRPAAEANQVGDFERLSVEYWKLRGDGFWWVRR